MTSKVPQGRLIALAQEQLAQIRPRTVLIACAAGYALWSWIRSLCRPRFRQVKGWPFLGILPYINGGKDFVTFVEKCASEIGQDGVFEFQLAGERTVVFCNWEAAKPIFDARPYKVTRGAKFERVKKEVDGVFFAEGAMWRRHRQLVAPAFHQKALQNYVPSVKLSVTKFVDYLVEASGQTVNMSELLPRMTSCVLIAALSGSNIESFQSVASLPLVEQIPKTFAALVLRMFAPFPYWKIPLVGKLCPHVKDLERFKELTSDLIDKSLKEAENGKTLLAKLADAHEGDKLTREELVGAVQTLFAAGTDTTALTLAWAFYELSRDIALQEELAKEASTILSEGGDAMAQSQKLVLCTAVWNETLRLHAVGAFLLFTLQVDMEVQGKKLEAGQDVVVAIRYIAQHSEEMLALGDDVCTWNPKRWIDAQGGLKRVPMLDLMFGHGSRYCVGKSLATLEGVMTIAEVSRRIKLDPCTYAVKEVNNFTAAPEPDITVCIHARK
mmetsp:Transcript_41783/g.97927  ORF Transcript_41783/g.97927 Transcript_41783/m.97927 type:complete len:498 (-) Transcript_41783:166-1659(-)